MEHLEVNGVDLNDPDAYWIPDLSPLRASAERRGESVVMPYRKGGVLYAHRDTITEVVFRLHIAGADWAAFDTNEETIRTTVVGRHTTTGSILPVTAIWHRNDAAQWPAQVVVKGIYEPELIGESPVEMAYNLPLLVDGWFEP